MTRIQESIDVEVPISTAYNQWTQFETFPEFMEGVDRVVQHDDATLEWTAHVAGHDTSWLARITQQIPDTLISWVSVEGTRNDGTVWFESLGARKTRVNVEFDLEPEGAAEQVGAAIGAVGARVKGDLTRFRDYIEEQGEETGAWRGTIDESPDLDRLGEPRTAAAGDREAARAELAGLGRTGSSVTSPSAARPAAPRTPAQELGTGFGVETDFGEGSPETPEDLPGAGFGVETDFGEGSPETPASLPGAGFGIETDFGEGSRETPERLPGTGFGSATERDGGLQASRRPATTPEGEPLAEPDEPRPARADRRDAPGDAPEEDAPEEGARFADATGRPAGSPQGVPLPLPGLPIPAPGSISGPTHGASGTDGE